MAVSKIHKSPDSHSSDAERNNPINEKLLIAVKENNDFYDRADELERIQRVLRATTDMPIIIRGERCIGKTSLLNRAKRLLDEEKQYGRKFVYFSIEPKSVSSCEGLAREMWRGLLGCLEVDDATFDIDNSFKFDTFSGFVAQLGMIQARLPNVTFVVFMDEFDRIVHQCTNLEYERIMGLIHHIVEATDFPMVFFISILQELPASYGSPLPAEKIILSPFNRSEADKMVAGLLNGYAHLTEEGLKRLHEYTGGHPYFIKLLLIKLFDLYHLYDEKQIVSAEMLEAAAQEAKRSAHADEMLDDVYSNYLSDDERYILLWLAVSNKSLSSRDETLVPRRASALKQLVEKRGYLTRQADGCYGLRVGLIRDWLREWPKFDSELERLEVSGKMTVSPTAPKAGSTTGLTTQVVPEGICIDPATQRIYVNGLEIEKELTELEYRALVYLSKHAGEVVSKDEFTNHLWGKAYHAKDDQRISALIYRLRDALQDRRKPHQYLETLRNRGFRLRRAMLIRTTTQSALKG
jgi:DNA-binding winged helix-turn-helix (wHTH) protein